MDGRVGGTMPTFDDYLEFEQTKQDFFNKLYRDLGFDIISRKDNKYWDVKLRKETYIFTIEEKARKKHWDDILVETIQDTKTNKDGWIYYSTADFLVYGMFGDPIIVYRLKLKDFQSWFEQHIDDFQERISEQGWGRTINKVVPIIDIPQKLIKRLC